MKKFLLALCLSALFVVINTDSAMSQVQTSNVAVTIATVTELTANNTNLATFAFSNGSELETGISQTNAVSLAYKSNKLTKITIKALGTGFFSSTTGSTDMPVSVIQWKKNGVGSFTPLSTTSADLSASQAKGSSSFGIDYKITPGLLYDPANDYSVTIEYTLTAL
ncbi:hypothetical protein WG906_02540 [Pedobacter sp. P351]|uniref:hypothetical protein n=1 Tax=Pedobacter superstes TaxID=3133441 RepID=UPI0030B5A3EC